MSFLKIKDPTKRDEIVKEFLESKRNIKLNSMIEKIGEDIDQQEYKKIFKPITEQSKENVEAIEKLSENLSDKDKLKIPLAIEDKSDDKLEFGPIATEYLKKYLTKEGADKTFGFSENNGKFFMGDKEINFENDDVIVGEEKYKGTKGLWDLIVSKDPQDFTDEDVLQYKDLLLETNAIKQKGSNKPKSSKSRKWNQIIKPIWDEYYKGRITEITGEGLEDLIDRFDLLIRSKNAGHNNVKNECKNILKKLLKENVIDKNEYNLLHKKC